MFAYVLHLAHAGTVRPALQKPSLLPVPYSAWFAPVGLFLLLFFLLLLIFFPYEAVYFAFSRQLSLCDEFGLGNKMLTYGTWELYLRSCTVKAMKKSRVCYFTLSHNRMWHFLQIVHRSFNGRPVHLSTENGSCYWPSLQNLRFAKAENDEPYLCCAWSKSKNR